jgi:long-chain fatty acid transport protein
MEMQRHRSTRSFLAVVSLALALPTAARAQGFGINEIGTCAASRAFAVTGSPCQDASVIFWNPAAATTLKGWSGLAGTAFISIGGAFIQDTTFRRFEGDVPLAVVPHLFVNYKPASGPLSLNGKAAWGLGVYVPYGLTSQWTDSFPGRFQAKKAALQTVYIQPNFAYQITSKWSVGAGPVIAVSDVELIQALDLSAQVANPTTTPPTTFAQLGIARRTEFGRARLKGRSTAFGGHLGVFGAPTPEWTVGARFLLPITFDYGGSDATFTQTNTGIVLPPGNPICANPAGPDPSACAGGATGPANIDALMTARAFGASGPLVSQDVFTQITHPAQVQAGVGYTGFKDWTLSGDYIWTGWKRFKELPIFFSGPASVSNRVLIEDYNNSSAVRLSAQRAFTNGAQLRFGVSGVASAAPDETVTPLLPEQDRAYLSIGGAYPINSNFTIEGAYLKVLAPGKRGRIDDRTLRTQTAAQLNTGRYELDANVFSVSLKVTY